MVKYFRSYIKQTHTMSTPLLIATIYTNSNYGGNSLNLYDNVLQVNDLTFYGFYNNISSIKTFSAYHEITFYNQINCTGLSITLRGGNAPKNLNNSFGYMNDAIKSYKIVYVGLSAPLLTLFKDADYQGIWYTLNASDSNLTDTIIQYATSSLLLYPNTGVILYTGQNFTGTAEPYSNTTSGITYHNVVNNDQIKSISVFTV